MFASEKRKRWTAGRYQNINLLQNWKHNMEGLKKRLRTELRSLGPSPCRHCLIQVTRQVRNNVDHYNQPVEGKMRAKRKLQHALECLRLIPGRSESDEMVSLAWT